MPSTCYWRCCEWRPVVSVEQYDYCYSSSNADNRQETYRCPVGLGYDGGADDQRDFRKPHRNDEAGDADGAAKVGTLQWLDETDQNADRVKDGAGGGSVEQPVFGS